MCFSVQVCVCLHPAVIAGTPERAYQDILVPGTLKMPTNSGSPVWSIALFAMFTSVMAASLATQNVATRMWYGMARTGVLPRVVARVDPKRKTPTVAVLLQFLLSMGLAF